MQFNYWTGLMTGIAIGPFIKLAWDYLKPRIWAALQKRIKELR